LRLLDPILGLQSHRRWGGLRQKGGTRGAHQIKVMAGGGVATPSDPIDMVQYTEEEIRAAVGEAKARRTYAPSPMPMFPMLFSVLLALVA
jgi:imidazolonepropionase-like amidohydrolase